MSKRDIKILSCILAIACVSFPALSACADKSSQTSDSETAATETASADNVTATETTADLSYVCEAPVNDYDGRSFTFLLFGDGVPGNNWCEIDIIRDELNGEVINDAVINRNRDIENRYNVSIKGLYDGYNTSTYSKYVKSGDNAFEAGFQPMSNSASNVIGGYCIPFGDIPYIDLSKNYWDHSIASALSIENEVYMLTGDISTIDNQATWIMMFNKELIEKYGMETPYTYALDGNWTIDTLDDMIKGVTADINGDGVMDKTDQYGLSTTSDTIYGLFYSCGNSLVTKDNGDLPVFALDENRLSRVFEKTIDIMSEENTLVSNRIKNSSDVIIDIQVAFTETRALFYCEVMFHVANLRQMENDFGIIPMPKYDENQESYITFVNPAGNLLTVPKTNTDAEFTGIMLEAYAASSAQIVTPAYYDTALVGKYARDNESKEMLDILLVNRTYDLGLIYGWASFMASYNAAALKGENSLSSLIASSQSKIDGELEKFLTSFRENNA